MTPAVHAPLLTLRSSLQALVVVLSKLPSGPPPVPSVSSKSARRRAQGRPRFASLSYAVPRREDIASQSKEIQTRLVCLIHVLAFGVKVQR